MKLKRWQWIALIVVIIFILTNPSIQSFKVHPGVSYYGLARKYNFFVCSIYVDQRHEYLGILGNFFVL